VKALVNHWFSHLFLLIDAMHFLFKIHDAADSVLSSNNFWVYL